MSDIRKRKGKNGVTYQVRYRRSAATGGYAYATFKTRKEAVAFLETGAARKRVALRQSDIRTVEQAIDAWLDACAHHGRDDRPAVSAATLENYRWRARTMKAYGWTKSLRDLDEVDVKAFRSWLKAECPPDKARKVLSSFHSVLIEMRDRQIIADDPAAKVILRADARTQEPVTIPSVDEFLAILRTADRLANSKNRVVAESWERYRPMIHLAADTGMRPQEYLALPLSALTDSGVNIVQALGRDGRIGPPKTAAGRRYIPVRAYPLQSQSYPQ